MSRDRVSLAAGLVVLAAAGPLGAQEEGDGARVEHGRPILFDAHEPIEFTLEANFDRIKGDRQEDSEERPAIIKWTEPDGVLHERELQIRTRGIFRLKRSTCSMPPIRLNFRTGSMTGTIFEMQDKVKMVTFCRDRDVYEQNVIEEYLAYRIYNEVTDYSFGVRLAAITYVDTRGEDDPVTRYGFIIEAEDALAERLGGVMVEAPQAPPSQVDGPNALRLAVFQYLIGNTDWSAVYLHNVRLLSIQMRGYFTIAYDFDTAGFVDAPYAAPDPSLSIRRVRRRLYRGHCRPDADYDATYAEFIDRKTSIVALVTDQVGLDDDNKRQALRYLEDFYEVIEDEGVARSRIERACRAVG